MGGGSELLYTKLFAQNRGSISVEMFFYEMLYFDFELLVKGYGWAFDLTIRSKAMDGPLI